MGRSRPPACCPTSSRRFRTTSSYRTHSRASSSVSAPRTSTSAQGPTPVRVATRWRRASSRVSRTTSARMPSRRSSTPRATWFEPARRCRAVPPEHNHWHQGAVAEFAIVNEDGVTEATGTKVTFCLVDVKHYGNSGTFKKAYPRTYFESTATCRASPLAGVTSTITRRLARTRRRVMVLVTPAGAMPWRAPLHSKYVRG